MRKEIVVWETTEIVTVNPSGVEGTYRVIWHRADGPDEEFEVTPAAGDSVDEAVEKDLKSRLGP